MNKSSSTLASAATLLAAAALAGCATNVQPQLQSQTARALGGAVTPSDIRISDVDTGTVCYLECPIKWRATTPAGKFDCTEAATDKADAGPHQTLCTPLK
jgi:hypothetical protein